ncbi:hypothetical protein GLAREA_08622 [Glarea lozoyensis ATCC 20868]|uniref:Uncharacterized protein n=1 Tax=Glarea lozoyensis (strain ATCC 20868 / MF5171) TaxID=1116229 RepID=S3CHL5_GLAL2|nr:uncharacterized protein GLAREA_08622 [Glarea lozoyensis ATCC 20868]EPE24769.1 hypothetical protein GLAREA_08622 [Glarea lozoyensis ATCC 20868]
MTLLYGRELWFMKLAFSFLIVPASAIDLNRDHGSFPLLKNRQFQNTTLSPTSTSFPNITLSSTIEDTTVPIVRFSSVDISSNTSYPVSNPVSSASFTSFEQPVITSTPTQTWLNNSITNTEVTYSSVVETSLSIPTIVTELPLSTDTRILTSFSSSLSTSGDPSVPVATGFIWPKIPTNTILDGPAETSEAALIGGLFIALRSNRHWLTDPKLKSQYIENIKRVLDNTAALLGSFEVQPPDVPDCSNTKRKRSASSEKQLMALLHDRSLISGVTKFVKKVIDDVGKVLKCASAVVKNIVDAVEKITPDLSEIDDLTDTLAEIGQILEEKKHLQPSSSLTTSTSSPSYSSESSSTCTTSQTVTNCDVVCSLTTTSAIHRRSDTTTELCSTTCTQSAASCLLTATTVTSTAEATSTSTPDWTCSPGNPICAPDSLSLPPIKISTCRDCVKDELGHSFIKPEITSKISSTKKGRSLTPGLSNLDEESPVNITKRALLHPQHFNNNVWMFLLYQLTSSTFVPHGIGGGGLFAAPAILQRPLGRERVNLGVTNLYGCTSVLVTSHKGVWLSHFWQNPSFENGEYQFIQEDFKRDVLDTLDLGCLFDQAENGFGPGLRCQSVPDGWFAEEFKPEAVIITPRFRHERVPLGLLHFPEQVNQIFSKLKAILPYLPEPKIVDYYSLRGADPMTVLDNDPEFNIDEHGVPYSETNPLGFSWAQGKLIFQYDPKQTIHEFPGLCDPILLASSEVWVEDRLEPVLKKDWAALPEIQYSIEEITQPSAGVLRRADKSACSVSFSSISSSALASITTKSDSSFTISTTTTDASSNSITTTESSMTTASATTVPINITESETSLTTASTSPSFNSSSSASTTDIDSNVSITTAEPTTSAVRTESQPNLTSSATSTNLELSLNPTASATSTDIDSIVTSSDSTLTAPSTASESLLNSTPSSSFAASETSTDSSSSNIDVDSTSKDSVSRSTASTASTDSSATVTVSSSSTGSSSSLSASKTDTNTEFSTTTSDSSLSTSSSSSTLSSNSYSDTTSSISTATRPSRSRKPFPTVTTGLLPETTASILTDLPKLSKKCLTSTLLDCTYIFREVTAPDPCPTTTDLLPASCTSTPAPITTTTALPPPAPEPAPPPPPPFAKGICRVHIYYWTAHGNAGPFTTILSIFDNANTQLYTHEFTDQAWGSSIILGSTDTKLPNNVDLEFGDSVPKIRKIRSPADRPLPPQVLYPGYPVTVRVGGLSWGFGDVDERRLPRCDVGGWETSRGIEDVAPAGGLFLGMLEDYVDIVLGN